ncbi:hypothetical protein QWJ90_11920 [Microbacterium oryzae]|uniref:hypothetical protein n=1 Tax=Microbacterium oryzae TaxID=743009 RepID=UPI0025AFF881|nr:hypothetical protein [Microbacterium oryzae]MDN3311638.1 hypothetical protein [Microbacterium oryzae]
MKKPAKLLATAAIAGALALGSPIAASADVNNYTPSSETESVQIAPGQTQTIAFDGFQPNEDVTFTLTGEDASDATLAIIVKAAVESISTTKTADADGSASVEVTLPANAVGTYTLTATGAESDATATTTIQTGVAVPGEEDGDDENDSDDQSLSPTGGDMSSIGLWVGGGALLLGGGAVVAATAVRRQRQN